MKLRQVALPILSLMLSSQIFAKSSEITMGDINIQPLNTGYIDLSALQKEVKYELDCVMSNTNNDTSTNSYFMKIYYGAPKLKIYINDRKLGVDGQMYAYKDETNILEANHVTKENSFIAVRNLDNKETISLRCHAYPSVM